LFTGPLGPQKGLATPQFLYAANPEDNSGAPDPEQAQLGAADEGASQRPYETLTAVASKLGLQINTNFSKKHYQKMLEDVIQRNGTVLICWQHQDIPLQRRASPGSVNASLQ